MATATKTRQKSRLTNAQQVQITKLLLQGGKEKFGEMSADDATAVIKDELGIEVNRQKLSRLKEDLSVEWEFKERKSKYTRRRVQDYRMFEAVVAASIRELADLWGTSLKYRDLLDQIVARKRLVLDEEGLTLEQLFIDAGITTTRQPALDRAIAAHQQGNTQSLVDPRS